MRLFKSVLVLLSFLLFLGCDNNKKTIPDEAIIPDSEQTTEPLKTVDEANLDLTKYGIANYPKNVLGGLQVGDKAPDFNLQDQDGQEQSLEAALQEGPLLLIFLRAEWCPYCVKHLKEFQDNIQKIHESGGAKVIAVSPQKSSYMKEFHEENQLSFPILFDIDHVVMKDYKVFFRVTEEYNNKIKKAKGQRIEVFNGDTNAYMPVPATYLIDQNKVIKYVHYDPDYKKRSDLKEVLNQLEN